MKKYLKQLVTGRSKKLDGSDFNDAQLMELNKYSMAGIDVLKNLNAISSDLVTRGIEGDFVECGVWNGGSAGAISSAFKGAEKHIWLYDSFEGMPETTEIDGDFAKKYIGEAVGSIEKTRECMKIANVKDENLTIRKGWFDQTFPLPSAKKISILHVDCDWYESVMLTLNKFYPIVSPGGVIVIDDFGHFEGCREAVYDFLNANKIKPLFERFGHSQIFWIKDRAHNRDFASLKGKFSKRFHA
jgi:O-methyltransferase